MRMVLGPYDLVNPSPAAAAALALASDEGGVVTLVPGPLDSLEPGALRDAADRAPRYLQLLDAWRWTAPLWREGVLISSDDGDTPLEDIRAAAAQLAGDPALAPLADLAGRRLFDDPAQYLDLLSRDLLRGGADPAVAIPLHAGMQRFAARRALPLVRSAGSSAAGRLDQRTAPTVARLTLPCVLNASPRTILELRTRLRAPLDELRSALHAVLSDPAGAAAFGDLLKARSAEYASALYSDRRSLDDVADRWAEPARIAEVVATVALSPVDATLRSAAGALAAIHPAPSRAQPSAALAPPRALVLTVKAAPWDAAPAPLADR